MYDYWNHELMDSLQQPPLNPKRYRKASAESVTELEVLRSLLDEEAAARLAPLIDERAGVVKRLNGSFSDTQAPLLLRDIELHTGRLHREFKPGEIQESLIEEPPAASPAAADARSD
jgi:hypothetical protein